MALTEPAPTSDQRPLEAPAAEPMTLPSAAELPTLPAADIPTEPPVPAVAALPTVVEPPPPGTVAGPQPIDPPVPPAPRLVPVRVAGGDGATAVSVERFDRLLRDLLCFGLLVQDRQGRWQLRPDVEDRLAVLATSQRPTVRPVLHIGVSCTGCHSTDVTRVYRRRYLCEACIRALSDPQSA